MRYKTFEHMNCSLAQTLAIVGERWTLLILRDAFFGARRFSEFERSASFSSTGRQGAPFSR
jgi:DNA-binding HxlR family transcriptional regulator